MRNATKLIGKKGTISKSFIVTGAKTNDNMKVQLRVLDENGEEYQVWMDEVELEGGEN